MFLFQRLLERVRSWLRSSRAPFHLTVHDHTFETLRVQAQREQRTPEEVAVRLVEEGLQRQVQRGHSLQLWQMLTPREQEITALVCLQYTNRQIAARLAISPETVKTHVAHVLIKFGMANRNELRQLLVEWDFGDWEE